jgi:hypothetical protein
MREADISLGIKEELRGLQDLNERVRAEYLKIKGLAQGRPDWEQIKEFIGEEKLRENPTIPTPTK